MRKLTLLMAVVGIGIAALSLIITFNNAPVSAQPVQTRTPAPAATTVTPGSEVEAFFVACSDQAIVNLSGTLISGNSVYFQIFASDGTPIITLRRANVSGTFQYSERVAYPAGTALSAGAALTMQVRVARTNNPNTIEFDFVVSDVQDGCASPLYAESASTDTGIGGGAGGGTTDSGSGAIGFTRPILAPTGVLNPNLSAEAAVFIGARPSENFRSQTPGLIFAECNNYPLANPGIIYDSDRITIYWSWWARTLDQIAQHRANAQYSVRLNTAAFNEVRVSEPVRRTANYWIFYTVDVGNLRPGHYEVEYRVTWREPIFDGFERFGPGTENVQLAANCNFNVRPNPDGISVAHNLAFTPTNFPVHSLVNE
jgi:hypothetical protein